MERRSIGWMFGAMLAAGAGCSAGAGASDDLRDGTVSESADGSVLDGARPAVGSSPETPMESGRSGVREAALASGASPVSDQRIEVVGSSTAPTAAPIGRPFGAADIAPAGSAIAVAAPASCPGVLAAWNERHVSLSTDDGRTWSEVLEGAGPIAGVAMDDDGALHVLRGRSLATHTPDGAVIRVEVAHVRSTIAFAARAGRLAWWGRAAGQRRGESTLRYSDDGGASWIEPADVAMYPGNFDNTLEVLADRTVIAWAAEELSCGGGARYRWRVTPAGVFEATDAPVDPFLLGGRGARGVVYGLDPFCASERPTEGAGPVCAWSLETPAPARVLFDSGDDWRIEIVTNGERTLALLGRRLLDLDPSRAALIDANVPEGIALATVDSSGRALGLAGGRVVRRDGDGEWRVLR
jgi:hypothetical protein